MVTRYMLKSTELKGTQNIKLYHFVHTILSVPFCPIPFCPYTILSIPFCPYHFVRSPFQHINQGLELTTPLKLLYTLCFLIFTQQLTIPNSLSLLALFEVSTAFDMVDHQILLHRLEASCGIKGLLLWLTSYLADCTHTIISGDSRTPWVPLLLGAPQGSVLGLYYLFSIQLTFRLFYQRTRLLDIPLPTISRPMSMVLLLLNYFLPPKWTIFLMTFTSG